MAAVEGNASTATPIDSDRDRDRDDDGRGADGLTKMAEPMTVETELTELMEVALWKEPTALADMAELTELTEMTELTELTELTLPHEQAGTQVAKTATVTELEELMTGETDGGVTAAELWRRSWPS